MQVQSPAFVSAVALAATLAAFGGDVAAAQRRGQPWSASARIGGQFEYDDNPFLLAAGQKSKVNQPSATDSLSGRFRDMKQATDMIPAPALELGVSGPGLGGRDFELKAEGAYEANLENARRRHAELALALQQELSRAGRLRFAADWRPSYFHKNYLQDAVDANTDGDISPAERRYGPGVSREADLGLRYRHRLLRSTKRRPFGVTGALEGSYFTRQYDAPFQFRSRKGPGFGAALDLDVGRSWVIGVDYSYSSEKADIARAVLILDENLFGRDFNNNGSTSDVAARAFELVDYSRKERKVGVSLQGDLGKAVSAEVGYGRRTRNFSSTQPYDIANRGRHDTRDELAVVFDFRLASGLRLALSGQRAVQNTNRTGDPASTGEVADYTRDVVSAALRYKF